MVTEATPIDMREAFLKALGEDLSKNEGADVALANILKAHILKAVPALNAVTQAKAAILILAGERANSPQLEVADD